LSAVGTPRALLVVEDNPGDADLIREYVQDWRDERYEVVQVTSLAEAVSELSAGGTDVVLLDLQLPDGSGLETLQAVNGVAGEVPIVVLTGVSDERLALACIEAGAQDYLFKEDLRPITLRRALGYAISRRREAQVRDLLDTLERYRSLSAQGARTGITPDTGSTGAVRVRDPETFADLVLRYRRLLEVYIDQLVLRRDKPREMMVRVVARLGDVGAGPRELVDVHVKALDELVLEKGLERARSFAVEGRLLALEMMGLLVDYYRLGRSAGRSEDVGP
jgi:DNA-binding response OmpR family regulator